MSGNTPHLNISYIVQSQAQKEVTANEAFAKIDALLNMGVADRDLTTPPGSPTAGDAYIAAATATGDWAGKENQIAYYDNSAWNFIAPNEGLTVWVNDEDIHYTWDGSAWISTEGTIQNADLIGINTTADATNKLAVKSDAVLLDHNGTDSQVKVNKNSTTDTASHLFQTAYSGRAEFGLTGDDDFHAKVSADGSTWNDAFVIDKGTGDVDFKQELIASKGQITGTTFTGLIPRGNQSFTSSGTFTVPAGVTEVFVRIWGGGAGGSGGHGGGGTYAGGGGGAGGYAEKLVTGLTSGGDITVTVGSGGAGGAVGSSGASGGTSSFGSHISATGGSGGNPYGVGGTGGTGSSGDLNFTGGTGGVRGFAVSSTDEFGGHGGAAPLAIGNPGDDSTVQGTAASGMQPAAGGAGGRSSGTGSAGGAGGAGMVVVNW